MAKILFELKAPFNAFIEFETCEPAASYADFQVTDFTFRNNSNFFLIKYTHSKIGMSECTGSFQIPTTDVKFMANGSTADGYHTFYELYEHRAALTAALFSIARRVLEATYESRNPNFYAVKTRLHADGSPTPDGYFLAVANLGAGQIRYHVQDKHWDNFDCVISAPPIPMSPNGHTSADTLKNLLNIPNTFKNQR
jgi:hypothetical protein